MLNDFRFECSCVVAIASIKDERTIAFSPHTAYDSREHIIPEIVVCGLCCKAYNHFGTRHLCCHKMLQRYFVATLQSLC